MENLEASRALEQADRLRREARRAGRWYARYLVLFGVASLLYAGLMGVLGNTWGVAVLTPAWVVFISAISSWAQRKRTVVAGMKRLQVAVVGSWAVLWGVTVIVGSFWFQGRPAWWIAGGVAMAIPCLIGARVVRRRTA